MYVLIVKYIYMKNFYFNLVIKTWLPESLELLLNG